MSLIHVDLRSRTPIFEQIVASVESLVLKGILAPDEQLPSVRNLAGELGINPNTIQKAYVELEKRGIIYSLSARGSFVSGEIDALRKRNKEELLERVKNELHEAQKSNIEKSEIMALINEIWR
jgi:GntR family transcriptional regulator